MGKLLDYLEKQLQTEYKKDAEDCLLIYNRLKEMDGGSVWQSRWTPLVNTIYKGFPSDDRRYIPSAMGYIFLQGLKPSITVVKLTEEQKIIRRFYNHCKIHGFPSDSFKQKVTKYLKLTK